MRPEGIRELLLNQPFEPFELQLSTGERYRVDHPENLIVARSKCYLFEFERGIATSVQHIALFPIVKLRTLPTGRPRRRAAK